MTDRNRQIDAFLADCGWGNAARAPLADDASFRRYERIRDEGAGRRAVLMDAPPSREDVRPFAAIARHLRALGFSAPEIMAEDVENGFLLIEDLGDNTYTRVLANGGDEDALYTLAIDVLIALHGLGERALGDIALPPYDEARLLDEACLLTDWYWPTQTGAACPDALRKEYVDLWRDVIPDVMTLPPTLVLRDYHVDNLMTLQGRDGVARCGLLDFQDAVAGSPAYDVMSLIEDARRDLPDHLHAAVLERYLAAFPDMDREAFRRAFAILGAQRHAKVIGIFTRLCLRDGKAQYLGHIPRVWRLFERALRHPRLQPMKDWIDTHFPNDKRGIPSCPSQAT